MPTVRPFMPLREYQSFVKQVYGPNNEKHFTVDEMLTNVSRFTMRGLKGIRKGNIEKVKLNMIIGLSWFTSVMNQLGIDIEDAVWNRFPYACSYCGECPCACKPKKVKKRVTIHPDSSKHPGSIAGFQKMIGEIYPASGRTLADAGIHLAEEVGELSEAVLQFRGHHTKKDFDQVILEASDTFTCFMGVLNSIGVDYEKEIVEAFKDGCHVCKKIPCACEYDFVINFKS